MVTDSGRRGADSKSDPDTRPKPAIGFDLVAFRPDYRLSFEENWRRYREAYQQAYGEYPDEDGFESVPAPHQAGATPSTGDDQEVQDELREYEIHKPEGMSLSEWKRLMEQRKAEFDKRRSSIKDQELVEIIRPANQDDRVLR